jgi:DNA-binding MarR family transcriptional regulator
VGISERDEVQQRIESLTIAISVRSVPRIVGSLLESKLTVQQLKAVTSLVIAEGMTASALAQSFSVSMPTISKLVDRLVGQGLVERRATDGDQRVRLLVPTALGRAVVAQTLAARPELGGDVLARLSLEELRALEIGMRAVSREIQALDD